MTPRGIRTPDRYVYYLSEEMCARLPKEPPKDHATNQQRQFWDRLHALMKTAIVFPYFVAHLLFYILAFVKPLPWYAAALIPMAGMFLASFCTKSYRFLAGMNKLMALPALLHKFCIPTLLVILLSIFVLHNWLAIPVFIGGFFVMNLVVELLSGTVRRMPFNDETAARVYRELFGEELPQA